MSAHNDNPSHGPDATNYNTPPPLSADDGATRYSDAPADPHATAYTPTVETSNPAAGRLPRRFGGYELLAELGHGGMGVVYQARQLAPERMVALKVIRSGELADAEDVRRFRQEADEAARLDHPNIVPVYEVGEQGGLHFFTMKLVEGGSLSHRLERYHNDPKAAAKLTATAARAAHYAHQRQLLHRDLKPGNILLDAAGQPHVADFGLAKRMGGAGEASQSHGVGTPEYMAPEQARGDAHLTTAADVYALGGVLYALLTGRPPFRGDSSWATIEKVLTEEPTPPSKLRPGVPRDLETVCLKCLQKEPAKRYGSAEALADDLERWLRDEPIRARSVGAMERVAKWARRKPAAAAAYGLLLAALVLGAGGGGATWLWLRAEKARGDAEVAKKSAETAEGVAKQARDDLNGALQREQDAKHELTRYSYADRMLLAHREWDSGHVKRARELLEEAANMQEELTPGSRPWELDYFNREFHPELAVLEGHTDSVGCVAFSPDGARVASASWDKTIRLWEAASGKSLAVLQGHTGPVGSVAFSPDGTRLASAGADKTIRLWDAATGKPLAVLHGHTDPVTCVAFSPNGGRLASASGINGGKDNTVRLWDAATGKPLAILQGHTAWVGSVAFSPDGARLASAGGDSTVRLWDAATGKPLPFPEGRLFGAGAVAFSPDGTRLASADYNTIRLWDAATGKTLAILKGHKDQVHSLAFSPDGARLASAAGAGMEGATAADDTIRLWDAATGKPLAVLQGHTDGVRSVAFSPDGARLASASWDKTVRLWDGVSSKSLALLLGNTGGINSVAFSPDATRLACAYYGKTVQLWDAHTDKPLAVLQGHTDTVSSVAFSPNSARLASASWDKTVRLWDVASGKPIAVLDGHTGFLGSVAFSPDGARLASAGDKTVRLWDAATGKPLAVLDTGGVVSVAFSPDGARLASGGGKGIVGLWCAVSGKPLVVLQGHTAQVQSLAFSPDGARLASASWDKSIRLWDAASGKTLAILEGHTAEVSSVAFSPDGARLASASHDHTIRLWDATSGKQLAVLEGHTDLVSSVAFSPNGARLASASWDKTVRLSIARESPKDWEKREREQNQLWREQQADAAEKERNWFAAAFHLSRLIDETPADATLYARRFAAEFRLGRWQPAAADFLQALLRWPADNDAAPPRPSRAGA